MTTIIPIFSCLTLIASALLSSPALAQSAPLSPTVARYVSVDRSVPVLLQDVRIIDGTGGAAVDHQDVLIVGGKISSISLTGSAPPAGTRVLPLSGHSVFPGLVGMHNHLFHKAEPNRDATGRYDQPVLVPQMTFSAPLLYLGAGVTTLRTTGSVEPFTDINLARRIEEGRMPGPHMDVTGPYLEGRPSPSIQMHELRDAEDARQQVKFWLSQGVTSFKVYDSINREELSAAIQEVHAARFKITGHLCSITYPEAAELGIDNIEHGFFYNTQLETGKVQDVCPRTRGSQTLRTMKAGSQQSAALMRLLVERNVAITSTLPVFESTYRRVPAEQRILEVLAPSARDAWLNEINKNFAAIDVTQAAERVADFANAMALEREFVAAGGLLMTGPDPTTHGVVPGYGDQRGIELLVEAGFSPEQAIRIGTLNGAQYLKRDKQIGSIAIGKNADIVVVKGNPTTDIRAIRDVVTVFQDGVGYEPQRLIAAARGRYGAY